MNTPCQNLPHVVRTETVRGLPWLRYSDGRLLPIVSGGDGPTPAPGGTTTTTGAPTITSPAPSSPAPTSPPANVPAGYLSPDQHQAELNRIAAAEKAQGQRAGESAILAQLGITDAAEAKAIIDAHREAERGKLNAQQQAEADASAAKTAAEADRAAAAADRKAAAVERALLSSGLALPEKVEDHAKVLARATRLVDIDGDLTAEKVTAAVADLKATMPALFTAPGRPTPNGDPSGRADRPSGAAVGIEAGREKARKEAEARAAKGSPMDAFAPMGGRR